MKLFTYAQPRSTCRLYQSVTRHRSKTASNSSNQHLDERMGKTIELVKLFIVLCLFVTGQIL